MAEQTNMSVFSRALFEAFKEQWHADIRFKPGDDEDLVHAHKLVLAARSKVFRDMFEECKAPKYEIITLSELTQKELKAFLEFMYTGYVPPSKLKQHVRSLYLAADKYEVPYLQDVCRKHLISSLGSSNALDTLELSDVFSDKALRDASSDFIIGHMKGIAFSEKFKAFVNRNPNLSVEIMKAFLSEMRNKGYYFS